MAAIASPVSALIDPSSLARWRSAFKADPSAKAAQNALCAAPLGKVALNRARVTAVDHSFSVHLPENKITAQKSSGRCWMFAALNTFRATCIERLNVGDDFEFSQNHTMFWDKLEKANWFLANVLETLDEPVGSRTLDFLLQSPVQDGGQWHMFTNLIEKYGVVPKTVMPETDSSSNTGAMNAQITGLLRDAACQIRKAGSSESRRALVERTMAGVYRMLCVHLGTPPQTFEFQWRDKDKGFHREGPLTPQEFYARYVGFDLSDFVCLVHDPRPGHDFGKAYTVRFLGNVLGGTPVRYLNVDLPTMKDAAIRQMQAGESVWFGCDVGKHLERELGVMDLEMFETEALYGISPGFDKGERLMYGHSLMTHAMVFTGVDLGEDGQPRKWRVENSWGEANGDKGYFQMTDAWFDAYNYEVAVRRDFVAPELLAALDEEPVVLPPWDPMGSLA